MSVVLKIDEYIVKKKVSHMFILWLQRTAFNVSENNIILD